MSRRILLFLSILLFSLYIIFLNKINVSLRILPKEWPLHILQEHLSTFTQSEPFNVPIVVIILISFFLGVMVFFLINTIQRSMILLSEWKTAIKRKKKERIERMFTKGQTSLLGGRKKEAIILFEKILRNDPNHIKTLCVLGDIFREEGRYNDAVRLHLKARSIDNKDPHILYSLEKDYEISNSFEESIALLKEIREIDKEGLVPLIRLSDIYIKNKQWEEAYMVHKELISLIKDDLILFEEERDRLSMISYEIGMSRFNIGDYARAVKRFKEAISLNNNSVPAYISLGDTYLKQAKERSAIRIWKKGYKNMNSIIFLKRIEEGYIRLRREAKVIRMYQDAIAQNPNGYLLILMLSEAYLRFNMLDDALSELKKVEEIYPYIPSLHLLLGKVYEKMDEIGVASKEYQIASEGDSSSLLEFYCKRCGARCEDWMGRCSDCNEWNTIDLRATGNLNADLTRHKGG
ncbi:MAG: tetratricopeptide repeat protein [Nitrospinae bacterium]|nr:tetratricopeptide repeat protein [Nitrospinota bacterium]